MSLLTNCIKNKDVKTNPIWLMRQAGRYLPEFRDIRKKNTDFIKLCLNSDLASEITLQPIRRFEFDGAVIFSDILICTFAIIVYSTITIFPALKCVGVKIVSCVSICCF